MVWKTLSNTKVWIPAPSTIHMDVYESTGQLLGVWVHPWESIVWHITCDEKGRRVTGYTIVQRNYVKDGVVNG
jgi:hypothetical protein